MKILIACEESQEVCKAFRAKGHHAWSCDILPCSGGHPEWHIPRDIIETLGHTIGFWDLMIAHPPCNYLSHAGARWLYPKKGMGLNKERYKKGVKAKEFFMQLWQSDIGKIAIENPMPSPVYQLPEKTQVIQPYQYGHSVQKKTFLWLKNLPLLQPTKLVNRGEFVRYRGIPHSKWFMDKWDNAKARSKTFPGIAKAMVEQWGHRDDNEQ